MEANKLQELDVWYKEQQRVVQVHELEREIEIINSSLQLAEEEVKVYKRRITTLQEKLFQMQTDDRSCL
jgi:hypothetical protein